MQKLIPYLRRPDITFHRSGRIDIAARVGRMLGIVSGCAINIALHNTEIPCTRILDGKCSCSNEYRRNCGHIEYLLFANRNPNPDARYIAICYRNDKRGNHLRANSVKLSHAMLAIHNSTEKVSFSIGTPIIINGQTFLPIITRQPLNHT